MRNNYKYLYIYIYIIIGGVVDRDYRGIVKIIMINNGQKAFNVKKKMKIAQLIIEKKVFSDSEVVKSLEDTERGTKGFGSSGEI